MIGQTIESRGGFSFLALIFALLGIGCIAVAVAQDNMHVAVLSVLPLSIAFALWFASSRRFSAVIHEDRIELLGPTRAIRYDDMLHVTYQPHSRNSKLAPLVIDSHEGVVHVPRDLNLSIDDFYEFLDDRVSPPPENEPHPDMANYVAEQRETFGDDRVWVFRARGANRPTLFRPGRRGAYASLAAIVTGIAWLFAPLLVPGKDSTAWLGFGVLLIVFGFIFWLAFAYGKSGAVKVPPKLSDACLVVSPMGVAMIQGDMRGKLRWDEIVRVISKSRPKHFQISNAHAGFQIAVEGSQILVMDIYDAPISKIEDIIERHR